MVVPFGGEGKWGLGGGVCGSGGAEEVVDRVFAEDTAEFSEGEEWEEGEEDDDAASDQLVPVGFEPHGSEGLVVDEAFDELLEEVEG